MVGLVRAPTIRGRPTPARKYKTSTIPSTSSSLLSKSPTAKTTIPKALKRAEKRAHLLAKASDAEENKGAKAFLKDGEHIISKSSIRRRRRKARDEIGKSIEAGRQGGVQELKEAVEDLEMEIGLKDEDEEDDVVRGQVSAKEKQRGIMTSSQGGKVTSNQRKRVLAQEQARQNMILSDPAYKASPFEALRTHARNTLAASRR